MTARLRPFSATGFTYMNDSGTQIALAVEVALDRKTGELRVPNVWTALDPGIAVQPDNIVAQTESTRGEVTHRYSPV